MFLHCFALQILYIVRANQGPCSLDSAFVHLRSNSHATKQALANKHEFWHDCVASLDFSRCFRPLIWVTTLFKSSVCWMGLNDVGQRHTLLLLHSVCEMHSNASLHERHMEGANATCLAEVLPKAVRGAKV